MSRLTRSAFLAAAMMIISAPAGQAYAAPHPLEATSGWPHDQRYAAKHDTASREAQLSMNQMRRMERQVGTALRRADAITRAEERAANRETQRKRTRGKGQAVPPMSQITGRPIR